MLGDDKAEKIIEDTEKQKKISFIKKDQVYEAI